MSLPVVMIGAKNASLRLGYLASLVVELRDSEHSADLRRHPDWYTVPCIAPFTASLGYICAFLKNRRESVQHIFVNNDRFLRAI